jgi:hypothetical protein
MSLYQYNKLTHEFEFECTSSHPDLSCCTPIIPPSPQEGKKRYFNLSSQEWEQRDDKTDRILHYIDEDGFLLFSSPNSSNIDVTEPVHQVFVASSGMESEELGIVITAPSSSLVEPKWDGESWVEGKLLYQFKSEKIAEFKRNAFSELEETDYMIIREAEGGDSCSAEVKTARAAIRSKCNSLESSINSAETVAAVKEIVW